MARDLKPKSRFTRWRLLAIAGVLLVVQVSGGWLVFQDQLAAVGLSQLLDCLEVAAPRFHDSPKSFGCGDKVENRNALILVSAAKQ
jgi:hypothetical protein